MPSGRTLLGAALAGGADAYNKDLELRQREKMQIAREERQRAFQKELLAAQDEAFYNRSKRIAEARDAEVEKKRTALGTALSDARAAVREQGLDINSPEGMRAMSINLREQGRVAEAEEYEERADARQEKLRGEKRQDDREARETALFNKRLANIGSRGGDPVEKESKGYLDLENYVDAESKFSRPDPLDPKKAIVEDYGLEARNALPRVYADIQGRWGKEGTSQDVLRDTRAAMNSVLLLAKRQAAANNSLPPDKRKPIDFNSLYDQMRQIEAARNAPPESTPAPGPGILPRASTSPFAPPAGPPQAQSPDQALEAWLAGQGANQGGVQYPHRVSPGANLRR